MPATMRMSNVSTSAARQLDLFGPPRARRKPFTPEKLTSIALGVWRASRPVSGTLGERLFLDLRMETPGPDVVRYCGNLKRGDTRSPGLVWLLRLNGSPCGIVRIYLDSDGRAVERRVLGRAVGATVMPRPP
jgi:hypothetical protein